MSNYNRRQETVKCVYHDLADDSFKANTQFEDSKLNLKVLITSTGHNTFYEIFPHHTLTLLRNHLQFI